MQLNPLKSLSQRRHGQALVEFSLILPLLVVLIFGIIELARVMQSIITLQNSARAAARYAAIGAIKWDIFSVPADPTKPRDQLVLDSIVPCVIPDDRGVRQTVNGVQQYVGGSEALFATWYDGINCDPRLEDHQQFRRDILRIFSAMHEARAVSNGLFLAPAYNGYNWDAITPSTAQQILYDVWDAPYPGDHEEPGYLYMDLCSNRPFIGAVSQPAGNSGIPNRFFAVRNGVEQTQVNNTFKSAYAQSLPLCLHIEDPIDNPQTLENHGHRWWDAGGPGDRIFVFLRYNHLWITPFISQDSYVALEARRASVNESFRAPKAVGSYQRSIPPGRPDDPTPDMAIPTDTPTVTNTLSPTPSPTVATETPIPFTCDRLEVQWNSNPFSGNTLFTSIQNNNIENVTLSRVVIDWPPSRWVTTCTGRVVSRLPCRKSVSIPVLTVRSSRRASASSAAATRRCGKRCS
ncbi:MAG: pilus assembly protein [Anaerolineae bacterium]|nr:pilus assembly protein [Anaerolineae bacterium]